MKTIYAYPGDTVSTEDGFPFVATHWAYQSGNQWMAVEAWEREGWLEGTDDVLLRELPAYWFRDISEIPETGTLVYRDATGQDYLVNAATTRETLLA